MQELLDCTVHFRYESQMVCSKGFRSTCMAYIMYPSWSLIGSINVVLYSSLQMPRLNGLNVAVITGFPNQLQKWKSNGMFGRFQVTMYPSWSLIGSINVVLYSSLYMPRLNGINLAVITGLHSPLQIQRSNCLFGRLMLLWMTLICLHHEVWLVASLVSCIVHCRLTGASDRW